MSGGGGAYQGDDDAPKIERRKWKEFDCIECSANNPTDDGFYDGDEIECHYCGNAFKVSMAHDGRPKLKTI